MQILSTDRLDLEPVRSAHAAEAWPQFNDDRMWGYYPALRPATLEELRALYERWQCGSGDPNELWLNWLCRERGSGVLAGAMQATVRKPDLAYIAYAIYPAFQRKGYASEAIRAIITHLSIRYRVNRICAEMDTRNTASYRLVESLGFRRLETHKAPDLGQGLAAQEYLYELRL